MRSHRLNVLATLLWRNLEHHRAVYDSETNRLCLLADSQAKEQYGMVRRLTTSK